VETFISRHANTVIGTLSGFDRLVFRGTLRSLAHRAGMMSYLWAVQVLLKDFASHAEALTRQLGLDPTTVILVANSMFEECSGLDLPESNRMVPFRPRVVLLPQATAGKVANSAAGQM